MPDPQVLSPKSTNKGDTGLLPTGELGGGGRLKHEQVQEYILGKIVSEQLRPGDALPSEQQLADSFSIARTTVRQAMAALEGDRLITRVQGRGTFVHEDARLRLGKGLNIFALVVPELLSGFYPSLQHSFEESVSNSQSQMLVCCTRNDLDKQGNIILQLIDKAIAAVAIVPTIALPTPAFQIHQLQRAGIPVVLCHRSVEGVVAPMLGLPFETIGKLAAESVLGRGHRRVAIFSGQRAKATTECYLTGFREALAQEGVELREDFCYFGPADMLNLTEDKTGTMQSLRRMMGDADPPTAILATFDSMAELLYIQIDQLGLSIPEDCSLLGFGDSIRHGVLQQQIASVTVDEAELGRRAAEILTRMRCGELPIEHSETYMMPVEVYQGPSLGRVTKATS